MLQKKNYELYLGQYKKDIPTEMRVLSLTCWGRGDVKDGD